MKIYMRTSKGILTLRILTPLILWAIVVSMALGCFSCKWPEKRTRTFINKPLPDDAFKANISVISAMEYVPRGIITEVKLKVKNISNSVWPAGISETNSTYNIYLSYRWLTKDGKFIADSDEKIPLPYDIKPKEETIIYIYTKVRFQVEGDYRL